MWLFAVVKKWYIAMFNRLLIFLNRLECETYTTDEKKEDLKNPTHALTLKGKKEYGLSVFAKTDKDEKNYPAISSENDYPFLLSDSQVNSIKSKIEDVMEIKNK